MADNNFDILIRILTQQVGSEKATDILKKVREETTATGKEAVKQEEAVEAATKKTFTSKHQLKDMVKELGKEFPILGQVGRLALNPIAFTTAAITGAFVIWNNRVNDLKESLGGIEMPNLAESKVEMVERHARAYGVLADKILAAGNNASTANAKLDAVIKTIDANAALFKALGLETGTLPAEQKVAAIAKAADDLEARGNQRLAAAKSPMSPAEEAVLTTRLKQGATTAETRQNEASERIRQIQSIQDLTGASRIAANAKYLARYGGMSPADAIAAEQGTIAAQQAPIDRYQNFTMDITARRKLAESGQADKDAAAAKDPEVVALLREIANATAARAPLPTSAPGNDSELLKFIAATAKLAANLPAVTAAIEKANAASARIAERLNNQSQRP